MISTRIKDIDLEFQTDPVLFSPHGIDAGTMAMLSVGDFPRDGKVLDLGCGYGVVGILAAKLAGEENVIMCNISEQAVESREEKCDSKRRTRYRHQVERRLRPHRRKRLYAYIVQSPVDRAV